MINSVDEIPFLDIDVLLAFSVALIYYIFFYKVWLVSLLFYTEYIFIYSFNLSLFHHMGGWGYNHAFIYSFELYTG